MMPVIETAGFRFDDSNAFLPESLTPLWHTDVYKVLTTAERLRYNQLCGIMVIDQFLRFEHDVLLVVYERPLRASNAISGSLAEAIRRLVADEKRHRAVFASVRQALLPGPSLVQPGRLLAAVERLMTSRLLDLRFWLWFGFAVEESGCALAERLASASSTTLGPIDNGMIALHTWHRADEVHHLTVDEAMANEWFDQRPVWRRRLDAVALGHLLDAMRTPAVGGVGVVRQLIREHPRLAPQQAALFAAVRSVRHQPAFQRWFASPDSCPRWSAALNARPELASVAMRQAWWTRASA